MARQSYRTTLAGTVNAAGSGSFSVNPPPSSAYWAVLTFSAKMNGTPTWRVLLNGEQVQAGQGPRVVLSLPPLSPGETVVVEITDGEQNGAWSGTLYGTLTDSEQDAMSLYQPSMASSSSTGVQAPVQVLRLQPTDTGFYTFNDLAVHTLTFQLPPNAQAFRWSWAGTAPGGATQLHVLGNNSDAAGLTPYSDSIFDGTTFDASTISDTFDVLEASDTQLILTVQLTGGAIVSELDVYLGTNVVEARITGLTGVVDGFAFVVRDDTTTPPSPYKFPQYSVGGTVAVAVGVDFTLLAATASHRWIVFDCLFDTNSGTIVVLELWDGPSATGTKIGEAIQATQNNRPMRVNLGGTQLTVGNALVGKCTFIAGGSSLFYTIPRSQVSA